MKSYAAFLVLMLILIACNDQTKNTVYQTTVNDTGNRGYFPVTDFLEGEIAAISTEGINPIKIVTVNGRTDSSWVKVEQFRDEFAEFLQPVIDSSNMMSLFTERSFLDQTINAFTFTYDPVKKLPDSIGLQHWDVYVDPQKNTVTRIYMLKKTRDNKTLQLTWQAQNWCKIVTITENQGKAAIEKEVIIKWDF